MGLSPFEREVIHARLNRTVGNPTAKAAIDMAVWDIIGQSLGVPVTDLLGGFTDRMRVSHMVGFAPAAEMVAEAERMRDTYGITTFKVKVGRSPIALDIDACRALRDSARRRVELYIDGNRGWTAADSLRALRAMDDLDLLLRRGTVPRRRRARPTLARLTESTIPIVRRRKRVAPRRGDPRAARRLGHRRQHQDRPHRIHLLAADPHQCEGLGADVVMGNQIDGQLGIAVQARVRRGLRADLSARRRAVELPRHDRRPPDRATRDQRRRPARPGGPGPRHRASIPTSSRTTARTPDPRRAKTHIQRQPDEGTHAMTQTVEQRARPPPPPAPPPPKRFRADKAMVADTPRPSG